MTDQPDTTATWAAVRARFEDPDDLVSLRDLGHIVGVSGETVRQHALREQWADPNAASRQARTQEAVDATRLKWEKRRADEADAAGITAARARQSIVDALDAKSHLMVRASAIAYGILIDKAQLLTGGATLRTDDVTVEERVERAIDARDEFTRRRQQRNTG